MNSTGYQSKPAASLRLEVKSTLDAARAASIRVRQFLKDQGLEEKHLSEWELVLVEATNNGCERALRPAVIQRKVTNGYRAMWAAKGEADIRTVVDTARLSSGANTFKTILKTVSP